eukprot:s3695_g3.t1
MPPTEFWMSKERLRIFRKCLKETSTTPEVIPDGDALWKDGWNLVVELLDQAEGMAHSQGNLDKAKQIERCNRIIEKAMSEDMEALPDVCRLWNVNTDWDGRWPQFVSYVGRYHLGQVEEAIPALEQLRLRWQETVEATSKYSLNFWKFLTDSFLCIVQPGLNLILTGLSNYRSHFGFGSGGTLVSHCTLAVLPVWQSMAETDKLCRLCGLEHPAAAGRMHGPSFTCTGCWAAKAMLERNVGKKTDMKDFTVAETHTFFRAIAKEKTKQGGRIQWATVRATLIRSLTDRRISSFRATCSKKELPLSVWLAQGWDKNTVEACPNWFSDELKTQVYAVPVRELSWQEEYAKIEQQILSHEREGHKKKSAKKGKGATGNGNASSDGELDLPVAPGTSTEKTEKPELARKKLLAKNVSLADKAAKALGPLQATATAVTKLVERVEKASADIPEGISRSKEDCLAKLTSWAAAAREAVNMHESTRELWKDAGGDLLPLPALPFDASEVKTLLKQAAEVQSALRSLLPAKEPKAKADAKGKAKAKATPKASPKKKPSNADAADGPPQKLRRTGKSPE